MLKFIQERKMENHFNMKDMQKMIIQIIEETNIYIFFEEANHSTDNKKQQKTKSILITNKKKNV